jgi:putative endonuclease
MEELTSVVYILFSETNQKHYTGKTTNIDNRIIQHNTGLNTSTKSGVPWKIIWTSELLLAKEASELEKNIKKRGAGRFLADMAEK